METDRIKLHMNYGKAEERALITIDDDYIVPDVKPDIVQKIKETGEVVIDKVRAMEGRVGISGKFCYKLLYATDNCCECMEGTVDFEETVNMDVTPQEIVRCVGNIEDITITIINSRKISVKAVIVLTVYADAVAGVDAVCSARTDKLQSISRKLNIMQLETSKKDIYRIREAVNLPSDRLNIGRIIWSEIEIRNLDIREGEGELSLKGELSLFCIYISESDENRLFHYDNVVGFAGKIPLTDCSSEMIPDIAITISQKSLTARADANGEMRILDAEVILDFDIKCYTEKEYELLADVYSPAYELTPVTEKTEYETFVTGKRVVCRSEEHVKQPESGITQIINCQGRINVEDISIDENGINIEGAVSTGILYIKDDDKLGYTTCEIPFSQQSELPEHKKNCVIRGKAGGLQLSATMSDGSFNIKCSAEIDVLVVEKNSENLITEIDVKEPDYNRIKRLPGIAGYITKEGDTLWDIAKRYCTTIDSIVETNKLQDATLKAGTKLLVVKST